VTSSTGDHVIPAVAVDRDNVGRLAVVYLRDENADCVSLDCAVSFNYLSSINGGASWSGPTKISESMSFSRIDGM